MKRKRISVTREFGFIGAHVCERFLENDYEVICVETFFIVDKQNIESLIENRHFEFVRYNTT